MKKKENDNVVFIGRKEITAYVLAVVTQFNSGEPEVVIKARGRAISRAVDVAEITRTKQLKNLTVTNVEIGTDEVEDKEVPEKVFNVSTIEITLAIEPKK